jgi:GAF domain-containing protein
MAEETLDLRSIPKAEAYRQLDEQLRAVLSGIRDPIAAMATMSALVRVMRAHDPRSLCRSWMAAAR